ncbi:fructosamine kinase family protein [Nocardioides bruguierae]|uniref:Fructosamine kinase family protein n=1 Tax=Nocardioides bruguierae TaxID=2945102 RepID=A0A9X2D704_9ACTN|nr:fructosamine kinase family protein [Nocardioides bruguierae]MCL8024049.1 fructosamine kinase family protein [Nocardioides bruguierae]MCM0620285.1 fructosamine kinase family protein [Nocardioides bruguierae]
MTTGVARRAERLLGAAVSATSQVAGGDIAHATKIRLSDGRTALVKSLPGAPADFFATEAAGLRWLADAGGVPVPEILAVDEECLILRWVEPGRASAEAAAALGRGLATTHAAGAPTFGAERDGYAGRLPLPNRPAPTWGEFFAVRRVLPYLKLARDRGAIEPEDATSIEQVAGRLPRLVPEEAPARLHGDLWNGNVLWGLPVGAPPGAETVPHLIDPAAHGGHRETDLALLALFGLPHLPQVLEAYEEASPLAEGWRDRLGLHQLFPLLVHACLFGGGYGPRAAETARRYL